VPAAAEMIVTSGTHSLAGAQATAMTLATTAMPREAEMSETVVIPTIVSFGINSLKTCQNSKNL
jgi:hypothetical protein